MIVIQKAVFMRFAANVMDHQNGSKNTGGQGKKANAKEDQKCGNDASDKGGGDDIAVADMRQGHQGIPDAGQRGMNARVDQRQNEATGRHHYRNDNQ